MVQQRLPAVPPPALPQSLHLQAAVPLQQGLLLMRGLCSRRLQLTACRQDLQ